MVFVPGLYKVFLLSKMKKKIWKEKNQNMKTASPTQQIFRHIRSLNIVYQYINHELLMPNNRHEIGGLISMLARIQINEWTKNNKKKIAQYPTEIS